MSINNQNEDFFDELYTINAKIDNLKVNNLEADNAQIDNIVISGAIFDEIKVNKISKNTNTDIKVDDPLNMQDNTIEFNSTGEHIIFKNPLSTSSFSNGIIWTETIANTPTLALGFNNQDTVPGTAYLWNYANSGIKIGTNGTERLRIPNTGIILNNANNQVLGINGTTIQQRSLDNLSITSLISPTITTNTVTSSGTQIQLNKKLYMDVNPIEWSTSGAFLGVLNGKRLCLYCTSNTDFRYYGNYIDASTYGFMVDGLPTNYLFSAASSINTKLDLLQIRGQGGALLYPVNTVPSNPASGVYIYSESDIMKTKNSVGTIVEIKDYSNINTLTVNNITSGNATINIQKNLDLSTNNITAIQLNSSTLQSTGNLNLNSGGNNNRIIIPSTGITNDNAQTNILMYNTGNNNLYYRTVASVPNTVPRMDYGEFFITGNVVTTNISNTTNYWAPPQVFTANAANYNWALNNNVVGGGHSLIYLNAITRLAKIDITWTGLTNNNNVMVEMSLFKNATFNINGTLNTGTQQGLAYSNLNDVNNRSRTFHGQWFVSFAQNDSISFFLRHTINPALNTTQQLNIQLISMNSGNG